MEIHSPNFLKISFGNLFEKKKSLAVLQKFCHSDSTAITFGILLKFLQKFLWWFRKALWEIFDFLVNVCGNFYRVYFGNLFWDWIWPILLKGPNIFSRNFSGNSYINAFGNYFESFKVILMGFFRELLWEFVERFSWIS